MNWVVVLNLWSYKSCLYNQVSLHWNLHVKQPLIGKLVINQIRCHCLTMTRFMGKQRQLSSLLPFSNLLNHYLTIYPCQWMCMELNSALLMLRAEIHLQSSFEFKRYCWREIPKRQAEEFQMTKPNIFLFIKMIMFRRWRTRIKKIDLKTQSNLPNIFVHMFGCL